MKRFTADEIVEAFERHPELAPLFKMWNVPIRDSRHPIKRGCCALSLLCYEQTGNWDWNTVNVPSILGVSNDYALGFTRGHDGLKNITGGSPDLNAGYEDGKNVSDAVLANAKLKHRHALASNQIIKEFGK